MNRQGCTALLLPSNQKEMYECSVEHVGRDDIVLKITEKAKQARYVYMLPLPPPLFHS